MKHPTGFSGASFLELSGIGLHGGRGIWAEPVTEFAPTREELAALARLYVDEVYDLPGNPKPEPGHVPGRLRSRDFSVRRLRQIREALGPALMETVFPGHAIE